MLLGFCDSGRLFELLGGFNAGGSDSDRVRFSRSFILPLSFASALLPSVVVPGGGDLLSTLCVFDALRALLVLGGLRLLFPLRLKAVSGCLSWSACCLATLLASRSIFRRFVFALGPC